MSLIASLQNTALYDHPVSAFEVIETHISWVLLTGDYAYKIKKPVNFGFLDFTSLEKRHFYCKEEIRLNRRLAAGLYLGVIAVTGSVEQPVIDGDGPAIEYAVKMLQFSQHNQLDRLLAEKGLDCQLMGRLAKTVADFHLSIDRATADSEFGDIEHISQPVLENFQHIRASVREDTVSETLDKLEHWSRQQLADLEDCFNQRKANGFVRECHGDMHLRNIALMNGEIIIFDCIEFNKNFFWIDVVSEIAFLVMDLEDRQQPGLATCFLNTYLEITGDYTGLKLLRFYKVYRALVRAKVDALRAGQEECGIAEYEKTLNELMQYLQLAEYYIQPATPCLLINHGLSGSGKSYISRLLLEKFPAVQIRSDVERKRLFEITDRTMTEGNFEQGIYTPEATVKTYDKLASTARQLLEAGYSVIIDAASLKSWQRRLFIELASSNSIPCFILHYHAEPDTLRKRITQRVQCADDVSDATLPVLEHQLSSQEDLSVYEAGYVIDIDTEGPPGIESIIEQIQSRL